MTIKPFDNYEISPCRRFAEPNKPGVFFFEVCEPSEADCWTLYGHIPGQGVDAIADCETLEQAEELHQRITGEPFGTHRQVEARLRQMHAAPKLLDALQSMIRWAEDHGLHRAELITGQWAEVPVVGIARVAIAEATGTANIIK